MFYVRLEIAGNLLQYADTAMVMFSGLKCGDSEGPMGNAPMSVRSRSRKDRRD